MAIDRLQIRRGTAAEWTTHDPVLADGEPGYEKGSGQVKYGDGVTPWTLLPYASQGPEGPPGAADDTSVAALVTEPTSETAAALSATYGPEVQAASAPMKAAFVPKWKANTAYLAGDAVVSPSGALVTAKANFTSSGAYSAANWNSAGIVGQTRAAEGTQTNGENITFGSFGYIATGGATNSVSGGSPNYENVIGGNPANVNTATSNLTGAPALVAPDGNWNSIWGGYDNVCNGWANQVQSYHSKILSGANHCTIGGGSAHTINTGIAYGTIGGGTGHTINAAASTIGGGTSNTTGGAQATVSGGLTNTANGAQATIGGGQTNTASASNTTVGGGASNQATGTGATVGGGASNQASNINATVGGGTTNVASGNSSTVSGGTTNTAGGTGAAVFGGSTNTASANYSAAWGREAVADVIGMTAYANGKFTTAGDAQAINYVLRKETTDATATLLYTDGVGTFMALPLDTTIAFDILVVARRTDVDGESAAYRITGCADRGAGSTGALVGTPVVTELAEDMPAWTVAVTAATSGSIRITVTGEAGKTIRWVARAHLVSVTG